ncbi:hypothetical protein B0H14DRAFT_3529534 [Mycena olivaceomarginata]|nr:hypothetical protein B0H14DRAFT_3529534 [Mycena olivaceomarginata]
MSCKAVTAMRTGFTGIGGHPGGAIASEAGTPELAGRADAYGSTRGAAAGSPCIWGQKRRGGQPRPSGPPALPPFPPSFAPHPPPPCSNVGVGRHEGARRDVGEAPLGSMRGAAACLPVAWAQVQMFWQRLQSLVHRTKSHSTDRVRLEMGTMRLESRSRAGSDARQ